MITYDRIFWIKSTERALKTMAQGVTGLIGTNIAGWTDLDWVNIGRSALVMTLLSYLFSLGSANIGTKKSDPDLT